MTNSVVIPQLLRHSRPGSVPKLQPNDARDRESVFWIRYLTPLIIRAASERALPLSLFISLFIFSLGERTTVRDRRNEIDPPPLEAVILVRGRDASEVSFGHCRRGAVLFWASTRLYLDETTLRELKTRERGRERESLFSVVERADFIYRADCLVVQRPLKKNSRENPFSSADDDRERGFARILRRGDPPTGRVAFRRSC